MGASRRPGTESRAARSEVGVLDAAELRRRRRALGLTQADLADRLAVSANTVARWERGELGIGHPRQVARTLARLERTGHVQATGGDREPAGRPAGDAASGPSGTLRSRPRHTFPADLSSFVGRERERARLVDRLATARLLTLTGPGGVGKTRLAVEVATSTLGRFENGACLVELAPLGDQRMVANSVAAALGIRSRGRAPFAKTLAKELRDQRLLLVLDNCEHVLAGCADLAHDLLRACPHLAILATSREPLRVRGEVRWPVSPLSVSMATDDAGPPCEAVQLFTERARAVDPDFALTGDNRAALVEICARLDGLPLAIELAAARIRLLPPQALLARLEPRLPLLTGGELDRPTRHQTLRSTIRWSYDLLGPDEQRLFRCLGIFRGGWTFEAAAALTAPADVFSALASLVDKSLVESVPTPTGESRFHMLETIREFAIEHLAAGERDAVERRRLEYLLGLCERGVSKQRGREQAAWFAQASVELDNIRAALTWALGHGECVELGLRLATVLNNFWEGGGDWNEGYGWLRRTLERAAHAPPRMLALALNAAGNLAYFLGDNVAARGYLERSIQLWRKQEPGRGLVAALRMLARVAEREGQYALARSLCEEGLELATRWGVDIEVGLGHNVMGWIRRHEGDLSGARDAFQRGLAVMRRIDDLQGTALLLWNLGEIAELMGQFDLATEQLEAALAISRQVSDHKDTARSLLGLARISLNRGDQLRAAESRAAESLELFRSMGAERELAEAREVLRSIQRRAQDRSSGRPPRAGRLTPRELEIVRLLAAGHSNTSIGASLVLSVRTVERHIENIYGKLDVHGPSARAAVAGYAARTGVFPASTPPDTRAPGRTYASARMS